MNLIKIHPSVYIVYYVLWLVFIFLFNHPYYIVASYVAIIALFVLHGIRSEFKDMIKMVTPMAILVFILNPLIYHEGAHRIYIMGSYFITLEATFYGCIMCATILLVFLLFTSYNRVVSYQEMLYVFSKKFANLAMVMIMALRFVPLLNIRNREVMEVNFGDINGSEELSYVDKIRNIVYVFGIVVSWSLEESMLTAKSMKSRAYGITKRSNYLNFRFNLIDYTLFALMGIVVVFELIGLYYGFGRINIYPVIDFSTNQLNIFLIIWVVFLMPLIILELYERYLWNRHEKNKLSNNNSNIVNKIAISNLSNINNDSEIVTQTKMCFNVDDSNISKFD